MWCLSIGPWPLDNLLGSDRMVSIRLLPKHFESKAHSARQTARRTRTNRRVSSIHSGRLDKHPPIREHNTFKQNVQTILFKSLRWQLKNLILKLDLCNPICAFLEPRHCRESTAFLSIRSSDHHSLWITACKLWFTNELFTKRKLQSMLAAIETAGSTDSFELFALWFAVS